MADSDRIGSNGECPRPAKSVRAERNPQEEETRMRENKPKSVQQASLASTVPQGVVVAEQKGRLTGSLYEEEATCLLKAVDKRRIEFAAGRECARRALKELGVFEQAILQGPSREPLWPSGIVGSITHCEGYCAAAVASGRDLLSIGIDAELNSPLPDGVLKVVAVEDEIEMLQALRDEHRICWDRLLFSVKESIYKAWYPVGRSWLDFDEARVILDQEDSSFVAQISPASIKETSVWSLRGRFVVSESLILTSAVFDPVY